MLVWLFLSHRSQMTTVYRMVFRLIAFSLRVVKTTSKAAVLTTFIWIPQVLCYCKPQLLTCRVTNQCAVTWKELISRQHQATSTTLKVTFEYYAYTLQRFFLFLLFHESLAVAVRATFGNLLSFTSVTLPWPYQLSLQHLKYFYYFIYDNWDNQWAMSSDLSSYLDHQGLFPDSWCSNECYDLILFHPIWPFFLALRGS
jgi:hypothetical protein